MEISQKRLECIQNIKDALEFREPRKVPTGIDNIYWSFAYAGVPYGQVINNPEEAAAAYLKVFDDIPIDYQWMLGVNRPIKAYEALGARCYVFGPDNNAIGHNQSGAIFMDTEDYDKVIENPYYFLDETLTKRRLPIFTKSRETAYNTLINALREFKNMQTMNALIMKGAQEKGITQLVQNGPAYVAPLDLLFDRLRGFRQTLTDLRRRPELVKEACDKIYAIDMESMKKPEDYETVNQLSIGMSVYHSECFLSDAQFDTYFMDYLKKGYMTYFEKGGHMFLKGEGKFLRTIDRYRDLPKGSMIIMLQEDDPFDIYKKIGDWQVLAAGIRNNLLKYGTKQECIDYVKKCYDTFAPGGGFIFLNDNSLLSTLDAKPENVLAVYQFADEYGRK